MLRTLSSIFLAGVMIAGGTVAATADMAAPSTASISTVALNATLMTQTQIESTKQGPAVKARVIAAKAMSRTAKNKQIRAWGGIPPCTHEDGSGQVLPCYWDGSKRGNGKGNSYIAMPSKGDDPRFVIIKRG